MYKQVTTRELFNPPAPPIDVAVTPETHPTQLVYAQDTKLLEETLLRDLRGVPFLHALLSVENVPTVFCIVEEDPERVLSDLQAMLQLPLILLRGCITFGAADSPSANTHYQKHPNPGASIGTANLDIAGSLGIYLTAGTLPTTL
jgi:hypothetical protein